MKSVVASSLLVGLTAAAAVTPLQRLQSISAAADKFCDKKCDTAWLDCLKDTDNIPTGDSKRENAGEACNKANNACATPPACKPRDLKPGTYDKCQERCLKSNGGKLCGERDWACLYPYHECRAKCYDEDAGPADNEVDTDAPQGSSSFRLTSNSRTNIKGDPNDPNKMLVSTSESGSTTSTADGEKPKTNQWSKSGNQSLDATGGSVRTGTNVAVKDGQTRVTDLDGNPLPITDGPAVPSTGGKNTTEITGGKNVTDIAGGKNVTDIASGKNVTDIASGKNTTDITGGSKGKIADEECKPVIGEDGKPVFNETDCTLIGSEGPQTGDRSGHGGDRTGTERNGTQGPVTVPVSGAGSAILVPFGVAVVAAFLAL